jgi:superfamily II DNA or RNA helicase
MKPIQLYLDQADLIERVRQSMRRNKSVLMQAATGAGKTVMAADMVQRSVAKGTRSIFIVPRRELLRQTAETFQAFGIAFGYVAAGFPVNKLAQVQLATAGTLARRLDNAPAANVAFVDETHYGGDELDRIIRHYQRAGSWVVGLSATPWKMSGKGMGDWYDDMQEGPPVADLIASGRLSEYRMFAPSRPDLSGIKTSAGDYAKGALAERMEGDRVLIGNAVRHYQAHASGRLNVAFCTSIKHAEIVADAFNAAGVPAAMVSGAMDDDERARRIRAFARRELHVLTSVDLLTFGFDLASAAQMDVTIECMSDMRPTKSLSLQMQKWGRVLRRKDFPALIFDHAGNAAEHGLPDAPREWTLEGREKRDGGNKEPTQPVRQCPTCYMVHRPAPQCLGCGFEYPVIGRMVDEVEGELQEVDRTQVVKAARIEQGRADTLDALIALAKAKGRNPQWAHHVWRARQAKNAVRG